MKAFLLAVLLFLFHPAFVFAFGEAPFLVTETATPIERESYQIDGGLQFSNSSTLITTLHTTMRYGLINNLEIAANIPYLFADNGPKSRNQFGAISLMAKVRFIKGREALPLFIGGSMQVSVPFGTRNELVGTTNKADVRFAVLASKEIAPYNAHFNLGYTFVGNPAGESLSDRLHYSMGLEYKEFRPNFSLMGELSGSANNAGPAHDNWFGAVGASTLPRSDIRLDGSFGIALSHHAPDYILSLRGSYFFN
jgi:hypothetical protein